MLTYTYIREGIFGLVDKPNPAIQHERDAIVKAALAELPDKLQIIMVVYCRIDRRSKEASDNLVKLGYTNIVEFGGILDWKGDIISE